MKLDLSTCTANDVIKASVLMHPSLLRENLYAAANKHQDYALFIKSLDYGVMVLAQAYASKTIAICQLLATLSEEEAYKKIIEKQEYVEIVYDLAWRFHLIPRDIAKEIKNRSGW